MPRASRSSSLSQIEVPGGHTCIHQKSWRSGSNEDFYFFLLRSVRFLNGNICYCIRSHITPTPYCTFRGHGESRLLFGCCSYSDFCTYFFRALCSALPIINNRLVNSSFTDGVRRRFPSVGFFLLTSERFLRSRVYQYHRIFFYVPRKFIKKKNARRARGPNSELTHSTSRADVLYVVTLGLPGGCRQITVLQQARQVAFEVESYCRNAAFLTARSQSVFVVTAVVVVVVVYPTWWVVCCKKNTTW